MRRSCRVRGDIATTSINSPGLMNENSSGWTSTVRRRFGDLALQLQFLFKMRGACGGLMGPSPERPGDDVSGLDVLLVQPHGHAADLLHRPADQGHGPIGAGLAPAWVGRMARSLAARQSLSRHLGDGGLPPAWQRPACTAETARASRSKR